MSLSVGAFPLYDDQRNLKDAATSSSIALVQDTAGQMAGDYVFFVRDVERRGDVNLTINGQALPRMQNSWSNFDISAKISLPARTNCSVKMVGGVPNAKLFVRPINDTTIFRSHSGDSIDYYFFQGPEVDDIVAAYRNATGAAPLWPKWAYGFWQCRERYSSAKQIVDALAEHGVRKLIEFGA